MMNNGAGFGTWLAGMLAERGLSQSKLARDIGVATGTVNRWVNEGRRPNASVMEPIARSLGLSVDEVMLAAGVLEPESARVGPRARLLDLISWLPDQEVAAVLAFAEFRAERARSSMRSLTIASSVEAGAGNTSTSPGPSGS
jgi:transcriptional regulator with XRE-family HTH domain